MKSYEQSAVDLGRMDEYIIVKKFCFKTHILKKNKIKPKKKQEDNIKGELRDVGIRNSERSSEIEQNTRIL